VQLPLPAPFGGKRNRGRPGPPRAHAGPWGQQTLVLEKILNLLRKLKRLRIIRAFSYHTNETRAKLSKKWQGTLLVLEEQATHTENMRENLLEIKLGLARKTRGVQISQRESGAGGVGGKT